MRKVIAFSLVLFLACCSVWAFPKKAVSSGESAPASQEETVEQLWEEVKQSVNSSGIEQSETPSELSNLLEDLSNSSRLTKSQLSELISQLEVINEDVKAVTADSRAKDEQIDELLKKAKAIKPFVNMGAVVGFKNAMPTLGAVANFGVKFGNGIQVGTGVQYQVVTFGEITAVDLGWNIDKLSITATIGYEW